MIRAVPVGAAIVGTVGALGLVALGSQRRAPHVQGGRGTPGLLKNLGAATIIVYFAVALYVLVVAGFRGQGGRPSRPRSQWQSMAGLVVFVLLASFFLAKFRRTDAPNVKQLVDSSRFAREPGPLPNVSVQRPVTWGFQLGVGLVLLMVVVATVLAVRDRRSRATPLPSIDRRALVAGSLGDLLSELNQEHDPRRAVLLADHGMEMALAEHGLPRAHAETANEFARRVADDLALSNAAAQTLTHLYGLAHFGAGELTVEDRQAAVGALQSVRDELRAKPLTEADP